jgi:cytochrome c553
VPAGTSQAQADRGPGEAAATGTVAVLNVYDSELPLPPGVRIKELRVVNLFPKDNPFQDDPNIGHAAQSLARGVLGTAPVEADGSVYFEMPAGAPVYFQLLDEQGLAVQTMRTDTYAHPGERLMCAGCHESKHTQNAGRRLPLALRRAPVKLKPEAPGSYPLTFARLVQPVLEARCVACHDQEKQAPGLRGDRFGKFGWSEAFESLRPFAWGRSGGNGTAALEPQFSVPGREGARASKLYALLAAGHHDVKLSAPEWRRITLWLDCNSNFYGAYTGPERQARGEIVRPTWGVPKWSDFSVLAAQ